VTDKAAASGADARPRSETSLHKRGLQNTEAADARASAPAPLERMPDLDLWLAANPVSTPKSGRPRPIRVVLRFFSMAALALVLIHAVRPRH
jgi:hypothetical protein